jgi:hypothetical protein
MLGFKHLPPRSADGEVLSPHLFHLPPESLRAMAKYFSAIAALCRLRAREAEQHGRMLARAARRVDRVARAGISLRRAAYDSQNGGTAAAVRPDAESGQHVSSLRAARAARK